MRPCPHLAQTASVLFVRISQQRKSAVKRFLSGPTDGMGLGRAKTDFGRPRAPQVAPEYPGTAVLSKFWRQPSRLDLTRTSSWDHLRGPKRSLRTPRACLRIRTYPLIASNSFSTPTMFITRVRL